MPLTRRSFIASTLTSAAAASPLLGALTQPEPSPAPSKTSKRTLKKAVMFGMIAAGSSITEKFQVLKDAGFDGVEMDSPSSMDRNEILAAQEQTGIKVHGLVDSVHWRFHLNNPEPDVRAMGLAALEEAIADAKVLGTSTILLVPAVVNAQMPYDDAWKLSQEEIRKALPAARAAGVTIAVENVWNGFLLSPLEAARYVDEFNDPALRFYFDIGNVINFGFPDQWARILGKRIAKLHIKDFSRKLRDSEGLWKGFNAELGDGDANWPAVMKELDAIGYSTAPDGNWATAEVRGGDADRLKEVSSQMDRIFSL